MPKAVLAPHKYNLRSQKRALRSDKDAVLYELPAAPVRRRPTKKRASVEKAGSRRVSRARVSSTALQAQRGKLRKLMQTVPNLPRATQLLARKASLKTKKGIRSKCSQDNDCRQGLVCSEKNRCRTRKLPQLKGVRGKCASRDDCKEGLVCSDKNRCRAEKRSSKKRRSHSRSSTRATAGYASSRRSSLL